MRESFRAWSRSKKTDFQRVGTSLPHLCCLCVPKPSRMEVWNSGLLFPHATTSKAHTQCQISKSPLAAKSLSHPLLFSFSFFDWPREGSWWFYEVGQEPGWAGRQVSSCEAPQGRNANKRRGDTERWGRDPRVWTVSQPCINWSLSVKINLPMTKEGSGPARVVRASNRTNQQSLEDTQSKSVLTFSERIKKKTTKTLHFWVVQLSTVIHKGKYVWGQTEGTYTWIWSLWVQIWLC